MHTRTQRLLLRGGMVVLAAPPVSTVGRWPGSTTTDSERAPASGTELLSELRGLRQQLDAKQGELEVARLQLDRVDAIMQYSTHYRLPADLATAVYDVALSEGIDPGLAFRMVKVESGFKQRPTDQRGQPRRRSRPDPGAAEHGTALRAGPDDEAALRSGHEPADWVPIPARPTRPLSGQHRVGVTRLQPWPSQGGAAAGRRSQPCERL